MTKKKEITNKTKTITDIVPEDELDDIFTSLMSDDPMNRQYKFFLYWLFGLPQKVCAKKVGYSESYASKLVSKYKNVPKVRHRVDQILSLFPERYRSVCRMRLPQVAEIEGKALNVLEADPKLAIRQPQLLRQVKQGSGVALSEPVSAPQPKHILISEMKIFWQQVFDETDQIADGEVIDNDEEDNE